MGTCRADNFTMKNRHYFGIVDYLRKFTIVKQVDWFRSDNLLDTCKITFYGLPRKVVIDVCTSFILEMF